MSSVLTQLWHKLFPPIPAAIRDEFAILSATRLQSQSRLLFLAMFLTIPVVLYASISGTSPMVRFGIPLAMGSSCLIGFISLIKDRNASGSPALARKFITEATFFSSTICVLVSIWCVVSWINAPPEMKLYYPFTLAMGSLTTIYCLATIRLAAILNIIIGIMPITIMLLLSGQRVDLSAAASLILVTTFLFRLISQQNNQLINLLALQHEIQDLANTDPLTGLFNRRALAEYMEREITSIKADEKFTVALIDLDKFKPINDQYGHAIGDKLLIEIANRLRKACGDDGIVARMGGDEFAILIPHGSSLARSSIATHMLSALVAPCNIDGHIIGIGASIGVADWPSDGTTTQSLFETADRALYIAKSETSNLDRFSRNKDMCEHKNVA